jgi:hypothetical protein
VLLDKPLISSPFVSLVYFKSEREMYSSLESMVEVLDPIPIFSSFSDGCSAMENFFQSNGSGAFTFSVLISEAGIGTATERGLVKCVW